MFSKLVKKFRKGDWKNCYSEKVTALSWLVVSEALSVHDIPSEDVIMVPLDPTTTYTPFPYEIPFRFAVTPEVLSVHNDRSDDVNIVPLAPITIYNPSPNITSFRWLNEPELLEVQGIPLILVKYPSK